VCAISIANTCQDACRPLLTRPSIYLPLIGAGVLGGATLGGEDAPTNTAPAGTVTPSTPTAAPPTTMPNPPMPTAPSCTSLSGTAFSFTGTLRPPRSCFFGGVVPTFASPISGMLTLQIDSSCLGTATTQHPNTWTFAHRVMVTGSGADFQLRSSMPFTSTQPFGAAFSSTIDITISGNSISGTESHSGANCFDRYDLSGRR